MRLFYLRNIFSGFSGRNVGLLVSVCLAVSVIIPQVLLGQTEIRESEVLGHWTIEGSPYLIFNDVTIPAGESLEIDPGVEVQFDESHSFNVEGSLLAIGGEDQRIIFRRIDDGRWNGIFFQPGSNLSHVHYCDIQNASFGISCLSSSPRIFNNRIRATSFGIYCHNSMPRIDGNSIIIEGNDSSDMKGIRLLAGSEPIITNNYIHVYSYNGQGDVDGIWISGESRPTIDNNWIEVQSTRSANGISISNVDNVNLNYNIIRVQAPSRMVGISILGSFGINTVRNNVHLLKSSSTAIGIYVADNSYIKVTNNIVVGNASSVGIHTPQIISVVDTTSGYNDFYAHANSYWGEWQGSEHDISLDPLWERGDAMADSMNDYSLRWDRYPDDDFFKSPCIDRGDPELFDPDGTRSDIGAVPFEPEPSDIPDWINEESNPQVFTLLSLYPNPFNSTVTVNFNLPLSQQADLKVFNMLGQQVDRLTDGYMQSGQHKVVWKPDNIAAGNYIIRLNTETQAVSSYILYMP